MCWNPNVDVRPVQEMQEAAEEKWAKEAYLKQRTEIRNFRSDAEQEKEELQES